MGGVSPSDYTVGASGDLGLDLAMSAKQNADKLRKKKRGGAADDLGIE